MAYVKHEEIFTYHDDPNDLSLKPKSKKLSSVLALLLLIVGGTFLVQNTLAANISLNSGGAAPLSPSTSANLSAW